MVLQKRLNYGFNGYQVPPVPQASRSVRRRSLFRKKLDGDQMCAFDLLATIAGKLLLERESSPSSDTSTGKDHLLVARDYVKEEQQDAENPFSAAPSVEGSCHNSCLVSDPVSRAHISGHSCRDVLLAQDDACLGPGSVLTSDCSEKFINAEKFVDNKNILLGDFASKVEINISNCHVSNICIVEESGKQMEMEPLQTRNASNSEKVDMCCSDDPVALDHKPLALASVDNSVKLPPLKEHIPSDSLPALWDDVKLVVKDDDEKFSGYPQPRTRIKACRPPPHIGDRGIRKLLASRYWKVNAQLKNKEDFKNDAGTKPIYYNRKNCYKRLRSQRNHSFKKKRPFYCSSKSNSHGGTRNGGISNSLGKGLGGDASGSSASMQQAFGKSAPVTSQNTSFKSRDSHVRLRIKSFKVPEILIELPETATVGSLKRRVMDAVTAILGSGLRVGVILQGKKVRDDSRTLLQTGISHYNKLDALGFTLEPNPSQAPPPVSHENNPFLLRCPTPHPVKRYAPASNVRHNVVHQGTSDALPATSLMTFGNSVESDYVSAPSPLDMSSEDGSTEDSKALVAIPAMNVEALPVVPMPKPKPSEASQRRIRRPFSVSEVEALVQAVEKLGTGRWRDVKLQAFDNAEHRTYVDLKDKWKTLVHTAKISPLQRRGEPVPQELLDRVLIAHAYWHQQQAKHQLK